MYKNNQLKSGFGNWGAYQAVWGNCTAWCGLKDQSMKQYDTVNKTAHSFAQYVSKVGSASL